MAHGCEPEHCEITMTVENTDIVEIVEYDPRWALAFTDERTRLSGAIENVFDDFEHIGSTAVPGLAAKPIIDMMAAVGDLAEADGLLPALNRLGYRLVETGMRERLFLQRREFGGLGYNLHIVETSTWDNRLERQLRDYLIANPAEALRYGALKARLADDFRNDMLAYTKAKTAFIQRAMDVVHDEKGLPRVQVWED
jgi:GrpB-like predicted nucleotidyltransferase (UPF0157 family)